MALKTNKDVQASAALNNVNFWLPRIKYSAGFSGIKTLCGWDARYGNLFSLVKGNWEWYDGRQNAWELSIQAEDRALNVFLCEITLQFARCTHFRVLHEPKRTSETKAEEINSSIACQSNYLSQCPLSFNHLCCSESTSRSSFRKSFFTT